MKKLLCFCLGFMCCVTLFSQRYSGASNVHAGGGLLLKDGYVFNAGYEKFLGSDNSYRLNLEYFKTDDEIESLSTKINIHNILAEANINHYFTIYKRLFFSVGAGGTVGWQFFEFEKPDYVEATEDNRFVFGGRGNAQIEYNFSSFSLFAGYQAMYLFKSKDNFYQSAILGVKIYY